MLLLLGYRAYTVCVCSSALLLYEYMLYGYRRTLEYDTAVRALYKFTPGPYTFNYTF